MGRAHAVVHAEDELDLLEFARRQREQSKTFDSWLRHASPELNWDFPHLVALREALDRVTAGITRRLIVTMPSQHGKSQMATIRYPVWRVIRDPRLPVIVGSYNEEKAAEFATEARKIGARWISFSPDRNRVDDWQTTAGGGIVSIGTTGGTGRPARLVVIDDPFKNAQDAESFARREIVWRWYSQVILMRRPQAIVVIATRWTDDDLSGRLLADKGANPAWEHLHLKALAEEGDDDPLGRQPGEALCPELMTAEAHLELRRIDPYAFETMSQGKTAPREGSLFQVEKMIEIDPAEIPEGLPMVRAWDLAASTNPKADETAGTLLAGPDQHGVEYVLDFVAGHWEPAERNAHILATARADRERYGDVPVVGPEDPGPHGKEVGQRFCAMLADEGFSAATHAVLNRKGARPDSKKLRAEPWQTRVNAGLVRTVKGAPWRAKFIDQHRRFTGAGGRDDGVDSAALGDAFLRTARGQDDVGIG